MMKKVLSILMAAVMVFAMTACGSTNTEGFDTSKEIAVNTREDGSGTRGAFIELFGVEVKDENGNKVDRTTEEASTNNSTSVMMTAVAGNPYAIGYISLGSLNDTVKAVKIDGAEATVDNIKSGAYSVSRPFNIVTKGELNAAAQDFVDYIMSAEGQEVIANAGYIASDNAPAYAGSKPEGKIKINGSSSVTPVMEKLKEAYMALNGGVQIEIQEKDSTTGVNSTLEGSCDIGMASRELKDSEIEAGLTATVIAIDGIAVIVNKENTAEDMSKEQVMNIYTGETTLWSDIIK